MKDVEEGLTLDERSAVDFVSGLRVQWARTVYPALVAEAGRREETPESLEEATDLLHSLSLYPWFSYLERQQQKMMWRAAGDAVLRRRAELVAALEEAPGPSDVSTLELDPDLELPSWYTDVDIHIQPGSFYTDDASAFVYELGARLVMLRDNDGYKFHRLFCRTALPDIPEATRVVDIGCGFGKSTRPLVARYPGAEVVGLDLSVPNLRLARAEAEAEKAPVRFRQALGARTGLEPGTADLVTGTMVLHEMPRQEIEATLAEAARLLKPGGVIRFLEFWPTGDHLRDATVYEHAERNNEPYFRDLFATDTAAVCADLGLTEHAWVPFDERERGLTHQGREARSEWHFPWAVLCATKPVDAEGGRK